MRAQRQSECALCKAAPRNDPRRKIDVRQISVHLDRPRRRLRGWLAAEPQGTAGRTPAMLVLLQGEHAAQRVAEAQAHQSIVGRALEVHVQRHSESSLFRKRRRHSARDSRKRRIGLRVPAGGSGPARGEREITSPASAPRDIQSAEIGRRGPCELPCIECALSLHVESPALTSATLTHAAVNGPPSQ